MQMKKLAWEVRGAQPQISTWTKLTIVNTSEHHSLDLERIPKENQLEIFLRGTPAQNQRQDDLPVDTNLKTFMDFSLQSTVLIKITPTTLKTYVCSWLSFRSWFFKKYSGFLKLLKEPSYPKVKNKLLLHFFYIKELTLSDRQPHTLILWFFFCKEF